MQEIQQQTSGQTLDPTPPQPSKKSKTKWTIAIVIAIIAVLAGGAFFLFRSPTEDSGEPILVESTAEEEESPTPTPTPTPEPVDKSQIQINVLNGSGIAREASFLRGKLVALDYSEIEVGNADDQTYTSTVVTFSSTVSDQVRDEIIELLEDSYSTVEVQSARLDDVDIRIITGLRPGQSLPAPTPTPDQTATESAQPTTTPTPTPTP